MQQFLSAIPYCPFFASSISFLNLGSKETTRMVFFPLQSWLLKYFTEVFFLLVFTGDTAPTKTRAQLRMKTEQPVVIHPFHLLAPFGVCARGRLLEFYLLRTDTNGFTGRYCLQYKRHLYCPVKMEVWSRDTTHYHSHLNISSFGDLITAVSVMHLIG